MNAPVDREIVLVRSQIPDDFRLDTLEAWIPAKMPKFEHAFRSLRLEWCLRQNIPQDRSVLQHEILQTFEEIAHSFDGMVESPGTDILATIQIFKGTTSEQALAVRPLGAWITGDQAMMGGHIPVPVIAVEWHIAKRVDGVRKGQEWMAGLRRGTLFQAIVPKNLTEFEAVVKILKENRKALDVQNEIHGLEKHCTDKSWNFSVICPADPDKKGSVRYCAVCSKPAKSTCSQCGIMSYCGRDCQRVHWRVHKKTCVSKVSPNSS